jgi:ABC-type multidrug transport system fused ATPase/permease subunit
MWIRKLFILLPSLKHLLLKAFFICLSVELIKLIPPYLIKVVVDLLLLEDTKLIQVILTMGCVLVAYVVCTLIESKFFTFASEFGLLSEIEILQKAHKKLVELDLSFHEENPSGELVHLLNHGGARLKELLWFTCDQCLGAMIQIVLTTALLIYAHTICGLTFLCFVPLVIFLLLKAGKRLQPYRKVYHDKFREASWHMNQSLLQIRTVKDYVQESEEVRKYEVLVKEYRELFQKRLHIEERDMRIRDLILGAGRTFLLLTAVYLVYIKSMTPGTFVLFATLSEKAVASLYRLGRLYSMLGDSVQSIIDFDRIFDKQTKITNQSRVEPIYENTHKGAIELSDVDFSYNNGSAVLKNLNLKIPAKKVCAFVGRSGAGKSTMVKLLMRHYDVVAGSIKLDGTDIRSFDIAEYRRRIAVVSQDIEIFDTTIHENIAYGKRASREEVEKVAQKAFAHNFILSLPQGYDTRVGERGLKLSGGQKQRIGIARALLMKPLVLIFDEATSSLDTESERMIQNALSEISGMQTMIIIAHRLSTISHADMIVVFDDGQIVEKGTQRELLENKGVFNHMKELQNIGELRS